MPLPIPPGGLHHLPHAELFQDGDDGRGKPPDTSDGQINLPGDGGGVESAKAAPKARGEQVGTDVRGGNVPVSRLTPEKGPFRE